MQPAASLFVHPCDVYKLHAVTCIVHACLMLASTRSSSCLCFAACVEVHRSVSVAITPCLCTALSTLKPWGPSPLCCAVSVCTPRTAVVALRGSMYVHPGGMGARLLVSAVSPAVALLTPPRAWHLSFTYMQSGTACMLRAFAASAW